MPAYAVFAGVGLAAAILWGAVLQAVSGGKISTIVVTVGIGLFGSGALGFVTRLRSGHVELVYLHHLGIVIAAGVAAAWTTGSPILATLDVIAAGMMVMSTFGRIGCHVGGCCHGRPVKHGVVYQPGRFGVGSQGFAGVPLAPVQLAESGGAAVLATLASWLVFAGAGEGAALGAVFFGYGVLRIVTEAWRGDRGRSGPAAANHAVIIAGGLGVVGLALITTRDGASSLTVFTVGTFLLAAAAGCHVAVRGTRLRADDLLLGASMARNAARAIGSRGSVTGRSGITFLVSGPPDRIVVHAATTPALSRRDVGRLQRTLDIVVSNTNPNSQPVTINQARRMS